MIHPARRRRQCKARNPRTAERAAEEQRTRRAGERAAAGADDEIRRALAALPVDADELDAAITAEDEDRAANAVDAESGRLRGAIRAGLTVALAIGLASMARSIKGSGSRKGIKDAAAKIAGRPGILDRAAAFAESHGATLISQLADNTRKGVREAVAAGLRSGARPEEIARRIREGIGLNGPQSRALGSLRARLEADGRPDTFISRRVAAAAKVSRNRRALTIAHDETFRAMTVGRESLWGELAAEGAVKAGRIERAWLTARDSRVDDICEGLDGLTAGIGEAFPGGFMGPPDPHVGCRCTLSYREV